MKILVSIILSLALIAGLYIQFSEQPAPELTTTKVYPKTKTLPKFDLISHDNSAFSNTNLLNKWSVVFFGYTS